MFKDIALTDTSASCNSAIFAAVASASGIPNASVNSKESEVSTGSTSPVNQKADTDEHAGNEDDAQEVDLIVEDVDGEDVADDESPESLVVEADYPRQADYPQETAAE